MAATSIMRRLGAPRRLVNIVEGESYAAQRAKLIRLRNEGELSSEVMRRVEHEIDLEESGPEV